MGGPRITSEQIAGRIEIIKTFNLGELELLTKHKKDNQGNYHKHCLIECPKCGIGVWKFHSNVIKLKSTFCFKCSRHELSPRLDKNWQWKGGSITQHGYLVQPIYPQDPFYCMGKKLFRHGRELERRRIYVHRLILARKIGRPLLEKEHSHHLNGCKTDNRPENLELITASEHSKLHCALKKKKSASLIPSCCLNFS